MRNYPLCKFCGSRVWEGAKYCYWCGKPVVPIPIGSLRSPREPCKISYRMIWVGRCILEKKK